LKVEDICKVPDCKSPRHARNYCNKHYRRFLRNGEKGLSDTQSRTCKWCTKSFLFDLKKESNLHFCSKACQSQAFKSTVKTCKVDGCKEKSTTNRMQLCAKHRSRQYKHGDTSTVLKLGKYPEGSICKVDNCKNTKLVSNYMCNKHYTMWRLHGDPKGGKYEMKVRKAIDHEDGTRTCSQCEKRLPINEFHKDKNASGGRRAKCKKCRISNVKTWYSDNRERQSTREKNRRQANPEKYAEKEALRYEKDKDKRLLLATEHSHLRKARKKKVRTERGISKLSLKKKFGTKCYYCGIEMDFSTGSGRKFNRSMATIEHLIPLAKGGEHTFENTVLACRHCNISKNAKTEEEFEEFKRSK